MFPGISPIYLNPANVLTNVGPRGDDGRVGWSLANVPNVVIPRRPDALAILNTFLPMAPVGEPYTVTLRANGGTGLYFWVSTALPAGLGLAANGVLSGTPTAEGTTSITFQVQDTASNTATITLPLTVGAPESVLLPGSFVQFKYFTSAVDMNVVTVTFDTPALAGSTVVATYNTYGGASPASPIVFQDNLGRTLTPVFQTDFPSGWGGPNYIGGVVVSSNVPTGLTTVTMTFTGAAASFPGLLLAEFAGPMIGYENHVLTPKTDTSLQWFTGNVAANNPSVLLALGTTNQLGTISVLGPFTTFPGNLGGYFITMEPAPVASAGFETVGPQESSRVGGFASLTVLRIS